MHFARGNSSAAAGAPNTPSPDTSAAAPFSLPGADAMRVIHGVDSTATRLIDGYVNRGVDFRIYVLIRRLQIQLEMPPRPGGVRVRPLPLRRGG